MGSDLRALQLRSQAFLQPRAKARRFIAFASGVLVLCGFGFILLRSKLRYSEPAKVPSVRQLTPNSSSSAVLEGIALSPDGKHLAYYDGAAGVSVLHIETGESRSFSNTSSFLPLNWLPDGDHLFVTKLNAPGTWTMSTFDGTVRKFDDKTLGSPLVSPDGKWLAFEASDGLWLMTVGGGAPHKVFSVKSPWTGGAFSWSPTGQQIAYAKVKNSPRDASKGPLSSSSSTGELQSCNLDGQCSTILSEPRLQLELNTSDVVWLRDGRVVFGLREEPPNERGSNLWSLEVDPSSGQTRGEPRRLTNWMGFTQMHLSASADGKHLVFQRVHPEDTIKIAPLRPEGSALGPSRSLNSTTWSSRAAGWTPDSKTVLFTATRFGKRGIFQQDAIDRDPHPLVSGSEIYDAPVITSDGEWLLYTEHLGDGSVRLMRIAFEGGPAAEVLSGDYGYRCAKMPSKLCVLSELRGDQLVFLVLDPFTGRGKELMSVELKKGPVGRLYTWDLSPDGKSIALVDFGGSGDQVLIFSLQGGGLARTVRLNRWTILQYGNWSPDGRQLYVSGGRTSGLVGNWALLETDLAGNFKVLIEVPTSQGWVANPVSSPDGRYLVYSEKAWPSEVMMLENF